MQPAILHEFTAKVTLLLRNLPSQRSMRGYSSQFMNAMEEKLEAQDSEAKVKTRTPSQTALCVSEQGGMRHPREFQ
jgi:hypothetical protein